MNKEEFIKYIKSIGFTQENFDVVKEFNSYDLDKKYLYKIYLFGLFYDFYNGEEWFYYIPYTDLTPLKKIIRDNRLNELLNE